MSQWPRRKPIEVEAPMSDQSAPRSSPPPPSPTDDRKGFVRAIVEAFRDAPYPSVDIAVDEIMATFRGDYPATPSSPETRESCPICSAPVIRTKGYDNGLSGAAKIASADTLTYAPLSSPVPPTTSELLGTPNLVIGEGKTFEEMLDGYAVRLIEHQEPPNRHIDAKTCPWCSKRKAALLAEVSRLRSQVQRMEGDSLPEPVMIHAISRIEAALNDAPNCEYCPQILAWLRRLSSDSDTGDTK